MTSRDSLAGINLGALVRAAARAAVQEAQAKVRTPSTLSGTVDQLDDDLDVVLVRMDLEAMGGDPTQSDNYEMPGVIPATRLGEANTGDKVRVTFEGPAGASATRTSTENVIVLPFGAETGRRIIADGNAGRIEFYDEDDVLVGLLDTDLWAMGDIDPPGARATFDPIGGLRMRDANDALVSILDQNGYSLRDPVSGQVRAEITKGHFHLLDPVGTDGIEMVTTSQGTLSNPAYAAATEVNPGASLTAPAAPLFTSTPADDIEIAHVAAFLRATSQSATMTPPAGHTEQSDENYDGTTVGTLQTSVATRDPATGATGDFTSTQSNWQHGIGTRVVVRGGGAASPAFRSISYAEMATAGATATASIAKPTGTVQDDVLVTFVTMGVNGGFVPTGWETPEGFVFLGAKFSTSGSGSTQSTLAVGAWVKLAGASEPSTYSTKINLPSGLKAISAHMVAIQGAFLTPGGVQIRMAGHPIRRLIAFNELAAPSTTLCDFQNISQAYDNLELVIEGISNRNGATLGAVARYRVRYNNDTGANYFWQLYDFQDTGTAAAVSAAGAADSRQLLGVVNGLDGSTVSAVCQILGYCRTGGRRAIHGSTYSTVGSLGSNIRNGKVAGEYIGGAINRLAVTMDGSPQRFGTGTRAYLYGY